MSLEAQSGVQSAGGSVMRPPRSPWWQRRLRRLVTWLIVLSLLGGAAYAASQYWIKAGPVATEKVLPYSVTRGDLLITVVEDGNVESANNVDVKCQVAGGSAILWIIPDGSEVKAGDKLVELDKAQLEEQINQQRITYEKARSAVTQAEKDYQVALISVQEYLEGTYKKQLQDAEAQITIALENLRSAQNSLNYTERMFRKGYVSALDLESAQFGVQRAQLELDSARTAKEVLEKFTKVKTLEDLQSKVETARAKMESEKAAFALEEGRLKRLEAQIANCVITAPADGMVVWANDPSRGRFGAQQGPQIEEGAQVRERQTILRIPDLTKMQVKVAVHESKVESIKRGMPARIKIQDRTFQGVVESVANQPEPTSFFSASVKEYATIVRILGETTGLKPGMTAEVEILVDHLQNVLKVPVAAVVEQGGKHYCWVRVAEDRYERRELVVGKSNDEFVEVKDGISEGDAVALNPRAVFAEARANASGPQVPQEKAADRFNGAPVSSGSQRAPEGSPAPAPQTAPGSTTPRPPGATPPGGPQSAPAQGSGPPTGGPARGGAGGPPSGRGRGGMNLMSFDRDGDGKVSRDEVPEAMQPFFDRMDENGDGFIDAKEIEAMRQRFRGAGGGGPGGPGGGPGGPGGGPPPQ
jgi:multidrug resistance efflux pump